ncbi:non-hydrolyzing UDP-N-acetylglucosamine 2-epimerase [Phosphitispora fastidiosa]|uniref:non-hydrolyzing UDP-N-acetylglucosamine 2-epimerase n=1 Tax=Phosphitispora fastidiosa TaxID=2837202 RepID=UPI001E4A2C25|nr:UDP-N-acetylglucosamine 2-epimerase (non-hydrolyzing) [Phosphitispora fastidiosa]MBU7008569.1 UDP-N-acetylglucosamine 2-epimerase (non-hydrolyzing) [Phosphitispora fastidiosa]
MKIMTVLGTRPEIIRLSRVIPLLDKFCEHVVVHTGQNYDPTLNDIFFARLSLRSPDYALECKSDSLMGQIGAILIECEKVMMTEKPDRLLILGDTNSALAAVAAKRMGIPVFHMEAGNRCYDDRVPEEVNRRIVDHCSDVLMPYTERSRANLMREGIPGQRIFVTGNPIKEVLDYHAPDIEKSRVLEKLGIEAKRYFLVTLHRAENVDVEERLSKFIEAFHLLCVRYKIPVICSLHPRTRNQLEKHGKIMAGEGVRAVDPLGLFDFVALEKNALCVLSDSGTVQEECCIFKVPNVTLRDVTERPETVESGSNLITGCEPEAVLNAVKAVLNLPCNWQPPCEYLVENVSNTVGKIILGQIPLI